MPATMIGDKDLHVTRETQSTRALQDVVAKAATELGYGDYFFKDEMDITDDHVPFLEAGIPAADIVDARFGRMGPTFDGMTVEDVDDVVQEWLREAYAVGEQKHLAPRDN